MIKLHNPVIVRFGQDVPLRLDVRNLVPHEHLGLLQRLHGKHLLLVDVHVVHRPINLLNKCHLTKRSQSNGFDFLELRSVYFSPLQTEKS